jgi:hypothetical protein
MLGLKISYLATLVMAVTRQNRLGMYVRDYLLLNFESGFGRRFFLEEIFCKF